MHGTNASSNKESPWKVSLFVIDLIIQDKEYKRMLDECKIKKGEECRIQQYKRDIYYWMDKIFKKIEYWSDHERESMYRWMQDTYKIEEEEECKIQRYEYRDIYYWLEKIVKKIQLDLNSLHCLTGIIDLGLGLGIGRYIALIVMNDFNYRRYYYDDELRNLAFEDLTMIILIFTKIIKVSAFAIIILGVPSYSTYNTTLRIMRTSMQVLHRKT